MICPFMSRPVLLQSQHQVKDGWSSYMKLDNETKLVKIPCLESECMAWQPPTYHCQMASICPRVDTTGCDVDTCTDARKAVWTPGFCALIP